LKKRLKLTGKQFDCGHFKKANEWLSERYGEDEEIDWSLNVDPAKAGV
jgi:uracil-DNA glycosylase